MIQEFLNLIGSFGNTYSDLVILFCVLVLLLFTVTSFLTFIAALFKRS